MNPVVQGLAAGYSAQQIIGFLSKAFPALVPKIAQAKRAGHSVEQVLGFLSKTMETDYPKDMSQPEIHAANAKKEEILTKHGLKLAATALAGSQALPAAQAALGRFIPGAAPQVPQVPNAPISPHPGANRALTHALPAPLSPGNAPPSGGNLQSPISPSVIGTQPQTQPLNNPISSQQPPPVSVTPTTLPHTQGATQPEVKPINAIEILSKHGSKEKVDELIKSGNGVEQVSGFFKKFHPEIVKQIEKDSGKPLQDVIGEYASTANQVEPKEGALPINSVSTDKKIEPSTGVYENALKNDISEGSFVSTPEGVGEVRAIRGGQAIVDVDGKKQKISLDQLEQEPEEIKELDLDSAVEDYLSRIPEGQKSSVIDVSLYDPETQELQIRFPDGNQWVYGPMPEEVFERINSMTGIPVSSGESKLRGTIWEKGVANSAGADFFKLVKKLVKDGVIKQRKLKTGIDLFKGFTSVKKRK